MTTYLATINVPGYLPMDDDPPTFEDAKSAWDYLLTERRNAEDEEAEPEGYSACKNILERLSEGEMWDDYVDPLTGEGTVHGETPGGRIHDLGLHYSVTIVEDEPVVDDQPCACGRAHTRGEHGYTGDES